MEIGRARFLAVTARVNWCRPRLGRARIAGGATHKVARMPGKRFDERRKCRKGKTTKRASRGKNCAQAPPLDLTLLIAVRELAPAFGTAHEAGRSAEICRSRGSAPPEAGA